MPNIAEHQSNKVVKLLLLGDPKSAKTGSLVSLVPHYKLRILDMDNLLDALKNNIMRECPDFAGNVEFRTLRDKRRMTPAGPVIDGPPRAFIDAIKMLDHWQYDDVDLGRPSDWGPDCILVIDSLSRLCDAAFDWREPLTPRGKSGDYDKRATYFNAQDAIENVLAGITASSYNTNVIVICHGLYMDLPNGQTKLFPQGVGQKLSPKIPQYFPNYIRYFNQGGNRLIQLKSDSIIDLAVAKQLPQEVLPVSTGLLTLFEALRESPPAARPERPQSLTLRKRI